jgi:hypothetical protein
MMADMILSANFEHCAKNCLRANIPQADGEPGLSGLLLFILLGAHRLVVTDFVVAPRATGSGLIC